MHAGLVYYDEHAPYPPGRRKEKPAGRFVLRTHIENNTPYRTSDLVAIVHATVARLKQPMKVSFLRFFSGTQPTETASFIASQPTQSSNRPSPAEIWLPSENCDVSWVIEQTLAIFVPALNPPDLRERTRTLRAILRRTNKIELRRRRGKG